MRIHCTGPTLSHVGSKSSGVIQFSEHLKNKSNPLNNAIASPLFLWESTGHAMLITRLIMLDTVVSRSCGEWRWSIQMSQCEQRKCKNIQCRAYGLTDRQLDLARFSSSDSWISISKGGLLRWFTLMYGIPKITPSGYYFVSSENDSIFPFLIKWSTTTTVTENPVYRKRTLKLE